MKLVGVSPVVAKHVWQLAHGFSNSHTLCKDFDEFLSVVPTSLDRSGCWHSTFTTTDGLRIPLNSGTVKTTF